MEIEIDCASDSTQDPDYIDESLLDHNNFYLAKRQMKSPDTVAESPSDVTSEPEPDMEFDSRFDPGYGSSVPLKRFYKKIKKERYPFYAPDGIPCSSYTTTIIMMFKRYRHQIFRAQRRSRSCIPWGKPVLPGRHHSKTIDFKKRGARSITMDTSEEEMEIPSFSKKSKACVDAPVSPSKCVKKSQKNMCQRMSPSNYERGSGDNNNAETQEYNFGEMMDHNKLVGFVELQPRVKPKQTMRLVNKRTKSVSPPIPTPVDSENLSDIEHILLDSASNSNDSIAKPIFQCSQDANISDQSHESEPCRHLQSSQSDLPFTQVQKVIGRHKKSGESTENLVSQKVLKKCTATAKRKVRVMESSEDEEDRTNIHMREKPRKKKKLLPLNYSLLTEDGIFISDDSELDISGKVSKTYSRKGRNARAGSPIIDFDKIMLKPVLKYSTQKCSQMDGQEISDINSPSVSNKICKENVHRGQNECPLTQSQTLRKQKNKKFALYSTNSSSDDLNETSYQTKTSVVRSDHEQRKDSPLIFPKSLEEDNELVDSDREELTPGYLDDSDTENPATGQSHNRKKVPEMEESITKKRSLTKIRYVETSEEEDEDSSPISYSPNRENVEPMPDHSSAATTSSSNRDVDEPLVECPLCCKMFQMCEVERHAATCGEDIQQADQDQFEMAGIEEVIVRHTRSKTTRN